MGLDGCRDWIARWRVGCVLSGRARSEFGSGYSAGLRMISVRTPPACWHARGMHTNKMATILKAENLEKIYRVGKVDVPALRGVSLSVQEGEFVAVMGPSGCGKSTMLHLLGGLLTPTRGRIVVDGEDLTAASDARRTDIRRRKIGFVFQRFNLFPTLTAEGNLRLAERIHANGADDPDRRRQ